MLPAELAPASVFRLTSELALGTGDPNFRRLLERIDQSPFLPGNAVSLYFEGREAFAAMHRAIDEAQREVLCESFILRDDATGQAFAEVLVRAAGRGVAVRLLVDGFGSSFTSRAFWRALRAQGIEVRVHPLPRRSRDHRKILVVDQQVAFTGGMNIGQEYATSGFTAAFRDTHARLHGPTAWEMAIVFSEGWIAAGGASFPIRDLGDEPAMAGAEVLVLDSRPLRGHGETASVYAAILGAARESVLVTNAYFAPRAIAVDLLGDAAKRGADVRLLVPGPTNHSLVRHAGHGFFADLLARGVRVFEYQQGVLHAKTLVADGLVSVVGSTNLDFLSFRWNAECNWVVVDPVVGGDLALAFARDLDRSVEVTPELWAGRSVAHRIGDALARRLAPIL
ncbi:MAG: phospholipase D-like domain-containing protein [Acidobacteriota bacterium]